jgi:superfamily II DNA/RNA helicase
MKIISYLPASRQTLMFSATMPPKIRQMAKEILKNPSEIRTAIANRLKVYYRWHILHMKNKKYR